MQYWQRVSNPPALTSIPAPPDGHPPLVAQLLARRYTYDALAHDTTDGDNNDSSIHTIDLLRNVTVTVGASQALFLALQCVIQQSDEVVLLMEPFFDLYQNQVLLAGGVPVYVPLLEFQPYNEKDSGRGGTWVLHEDTLLSKVTSNTKAILLNSPHNPTGKLFLRKEIEMIASAVVECAHPECIVLSDEVYKYIVHAPPLHSTTSTTRPLRSPATFILPHYPARGIVHTHHFVGGKDLFSYRLASRMVYRSPHKYIAHIQRLLPYVQFNSVLQPLFKKKPWPGRWSLPLVRIMDIPRIMRAYLRHNYTQKRDGLVAALSAAGLAVPDWDRTPGGGFFILARVSPELQARAQQDRGISMESSAMNCRPDWAVCDWLLQEHGLVCIPSKNSLLFRRECSTKRVGFAYTDRLL